jgi:hypothetical protein
VDPITYETENAIFQFDPRDLPESPDEDRIPDARSCPPSMVLDLISAGKGSITCRICNRTYSPAELKPFAIGAGTSPFSINLREKGEIRNLLKRKQKLPGLFGGKGYRCPRGHELISLVTWRT